MSGMFLLDVTDSLCLQNSSNCQIRSGWFYNDDWTWITSKKRNKLSLLHLVLMRFCEESILIPLTWVVLSCQTLSGLHKEGSCFLFAVPLHKVVDALEAPWSRFKVSWANTKWRGENATDDTVNYRLSNRDILHTGDKLSPVSQTFKKGNLRNHKMCMFLCLVAR